MAGVIGASNMASIVVLVFQHRQLPVKGCPTSSLSYTVTALQHGGSLFGNAEGAAVLANA